MGRLLTILGEVTNTLPREIEKNTKNSEIFPQGGASMNKKTADLNMIISQFKYLK